MTIPTAMPFSKNTKSIYRSASVFTGSPLTRLATLGTLSRNAGEGGSQPPNPDPPPLAGEGREGAGWVRARDGVFR